MEASATHTRAEPAAEPAGAPPPLAPALDAAASRGSLGDDLVAGGVLGIATFACLLWAAVLVWAVGWLAALIGGRPPWSLLAYLGVVLGVSTAAAALVAAAVGVIGYRRWRAGAAAKGPCAGPAGRPPPADQAGRPHGQADAGDEVPVGHAGHVGRDGAHQSS